MGTVRVHHTTSTGDRTARVVSVVFVRAALDS